VRSRALKTTVLAAVAGAVWTHVPQVALHLRRLSLKCRFIGHDDWIRRTPDRLYLECFDAGVKHRDGQPARVVQQTASAMSSRTHQ
jgi:hypothetical protein